MGFITDANFLSEVFWNTQVPEFELEGFWYLNFINEDNNNIKSTDYFSNKNSLDYCVQGVNIPQLNLNYESNDFGLISFKEKSAYDDVTLTFYDDINSSFKSFITDWLHSVFDEKTHSVKQLWRYQAKTIEVTNYRLLWGKIQKTASYELVKCLPKNMAEISMEEESGGRKTYSLNMVCQKVNNLTDKIKNN